MSFQEYKTAFFTMGMLEKSAKIPDLAALTEGKGVGLVVTSPPYPGVHMLYHRWQVDGRKETAAPYWIAGCYDGEGASYYNFGSRHERGAAGYFQASLRTLRGIRAAMRDEGVIVQMLAFNRPEEQLGLYLDNMRLAGFEEMPLSEIDAGRVWRNVPNRRWHAAGKGRTNSSREVVLIHRAV